MAYRLAEIRLDKLNVAAENLRRGASKAGDAALSASIGEHGLLVPLVVREFGRSGEYEVIDGNRRVSALRDLGAAGATRLPAAILDGGDPSDVVRQININQVRERLAPLAEAEALRQLVEDQDWGQNEAARALQKSKAWGSQVMRVWRELPPLALAALREGRIGVTTAIAMVPFVEEKRIFNLLWEAALAGTSHRDLKALAARASRSGPDAARRFLPRRDRVGRSTLRIEPRQQGVRVELNLDDGDDREAVWAAARVLLDETQSV